MSYAQALLILAASSGLAGWITMTIHRRTGLEIRRHHHEVGSVVFLQLGVVFAVLLAFVCNECLVAYTDAEAAIDRECGALHGAAIIASTLPPQDARPILAAEARYASTVLRDEWPTLAATRHGSDSARNALIDTIRTTAQLKLSDPEDRNRRAQILNLLADAHAHRETRMFQAQNGIPAALWAVLIALTAILIGFVAFSGIAYRQTATAVAIIFTAGIVSILLVARLLDYPFEGALALHPSDFAETLANIQALTRRASGGQRLRLCTPLGP